MPRRLSMVLGAGLAFALFAACSDDTSGARDSDPGDSGPTATMTTPPHDPDAEPELEAPASQYSILQADLEQEYLTDVGGTFVLDVETYGGSKAFESPEEGVAHLEDWRYLGGYETGYTPDGYERAVLNGSIYFWVETHLFEDADGALAAFEYINGRLDSSVSTRTESYPVGNDSVAWEAIGDDVPGSSVESVFHRVVFRRGNLVGVVATYGAEPLVTVRQAADLARIVDGKAVGEAELAEPTPVNGSASFTGSGQED